MRFRNLTENLALISLSGTGTPSHRNLKKGKWNMHMLASQTFCLLEVLPLACSIARIDI